MFGLTIIVKHSVHIHIIFSYQAMSIYRMESTMSMRKTQLRLKLSSREMSRQKLFHCTPSSRISSRAMVLIPRPIQVFERRQNPSFAPLRETNNIQCSGYHAIMECTLSLIVSQLFLSTVYLEFCTLVLTLLQKVYDTEEGYSGWFGNKQAVEGWMSDNIHLQDLLYILWQCLKTSLQRLCNAHMTLQRSKHVCELW